MNHFFKRPLDVSQQENIKIFLKISTMSRPITRNPFKNLNQVTKVMYIQEYI